MLGQEQYERRNVDISINDLSMERLLLTNNLYSTKEFLLIFDNYRSYTKTFPFEGELLQLYVIYNI